MIVRKDHGRCVVLQCSFHDFTRIDRCLVDIAAEQLHVFDQTVLAVEEQRSENLVLEVGQLGGR